MAVLRDVFISPGVYWLGLLFLCIAYLQGAFDKLRDFAGAVDEMRHFGLSPATPLAAATIAMELASSALILTDYYRWLGALMLAVFTVAATCLANPFWRAAGSERVKTANAFFEHWGLAGGFLLVAWHDLGGAHV